MPKESPVRHRWPVGLILAAVLVSACASDSVFSLSVGDCFDDPTTSGEVSSVDLMECDEPHDNEVYAIFAYDGDSYPGETEMGAAADEGCEGRFEDFVGVPYLESDLYYTHLTPTQESWDTGDREIVCVLYEPGEKLEGSMEGAAR
jgi:hypothetical protein